MGITGSSDIDCNNSIASVQQRSLEFEIDQVDRLLVCNLVERPAELHSSAVPAMQLHASCLLLVSLSLSLLL